MFSGGAFMKIILGLQLIALLLCPVFMPAAQAQGIKKSLSGVTKWIWGPPTAPAVQPYLEGAKLPHNSQWADDQWTPQAWIESRGSAAAVIEGFYETGIITGQYTDGNIPVLEVGQRFIDLSGQDKRRVVAFFDDTFGITRSSPGILKVVFEKDDLPVGLFSAEGLQLQ